MQLMRTSRTGILSAALGLSLATGAVAAEITATPTVHFTVGEDVINSVLAYRLRGSQVITEGANRLDLRVKKIYLDVEPAASTFHVDLAASWTVAGSSGSRSLQLTRSVAAADFLVDATVDLVKLRNALFSAYTDIPAWARDKMEGAVNRIYPLQGYLANASTTVSSLNRQVVDHAGIFSTAEFTLSAAFEQDRIRFSLGNKVRFEQLYTTVNTIPNPVRNMAFQVYGHSNVKFRIRKGSLYTQNGWTLVNINSGDSWATRIGTPAPPGHWVVNAPYPGTPQLGNGTYYLRTVHENPRGAWWITPQFTMVVSQ